MVESLLTVPVRDSLVMVPCRRFPTRNSLLRMPSGGEGVRSGGMGGLDLLLFIFFQIMFLNRNSVKQKSDFTKTARKRKENQCYATNH